MTGTTDAMIGYGSSFQTKSLDSPSSWVSVAEVVSITPPSASRDDIDVTHEHGPNEWRGVLPGMKVAGEASIKLNFVPGGSAYADLRAELEDQVLRSRRIVFPNGETAEFDAYLKSLTIDETAMDAGLTANAVFKVSGSPGVI